MKFGRASLGLLTILAAQAGLAVKTYAQDQDAFRRDRNTSVRERPRPEYDALGLRAGGFFLFPEFELSGESNSNVFADDTFKESDTIARAGLNLLLESNWNTHALSLEGNVLHRAFDEFSDQDATDWSVRADTRIDASYRLSFFANAGYEDAHEDFSSSPSTALLAEAVPYTRADAQIGVVKTFNRLRLTASARGEDLNYEDAELQGGGFLFSDDRDHESMTGELRADYAVSPATALFIAARSKTREYDLQPPDPGALVNRDSEGFEVLAGANFDISNLATGEIGVGYLEEEYDEPGAETVSGLAVRTSIRWFPDELWTVSLDLARATQSAGALGALARVESSAELRFDYEFRRNIIVGLSAGAETDEYEGIDRRDERRFVALEADYAPNRVASIFLNAGRYEQDSSGAAPGRDYEIDRVVLGLRLRR